MSLRERRTTAVLLLAWAATAYGEPPTFADEIKKARESLSKNGSSSPFIAKEGPRRLAAWRAAAEKGSAEAQWLLSRCYSLGAGVKADPVEAAKWARKSADQDFPLGQNSLALMYEEGAGVEQNLSRARTLYLSAAEQGEPVAQGNLARCHAEGIGAERDVKEAVRWYGRA